jgi:hypothetical protein
VREGQGGVPVARLLLTSRALLVADLGPLLRPRGRTWARLLPSALAGLPGLRGRRGGRHVVAGRACTATVVLCYALLLLGGAIRPNWLSTPWLVHTAHTKYGPATGRSYHMATTTVDDDTRRNGTAPPPGQGKGRGGDDSGGS